MGRLREERDRKREREGGVGTKDKGGENKE